MLEAHRQRVLVVPSTGHPWRAIHRHKAVQSLHLQACGHVRSGARTGVVLASAAAQAADPGESSTKPAAQPSQTAATSSSSSADKSKSKSTSADPKAQGNAPPSHTRPPIARPGLRQYHYATFFSILVAGIIFLAVLLYIQADIQIQQACFKVVRRLFKTVALRQVMGILAAMTFVRFGLEPLVKLMRRLFVAPGSWEKSSEYYILRELYHPLEFLFSVAAFTTLVENFLPQLIALPKALIQNFVRSTLTLTFVIAAARVVFNIKAQMMEERRWEMEIRAEVTRMRRVEAVDKLLSVLTLLVASVFGLQAIGLDVNSVLAIGGVGGLAVGLAGREILENLFTGLIILSSSPFEVGEEVQFSSSGSVVEGIVMDVGWYRTLIRSFEREIYAIPNSVFSRNVVLNITRKGKEWRFFEFFGLKLTDVSKAQAVIADMRKIIRADPRIIQKLHRRVFLDKLTREQVTVYVSCYVEAQNRDAFMAVKQDLLLAFVDCVERNRAELARVRLSVELANALNMKANRLPAGLDEEEARMEAEDCDSDAEDDVSAAQDPTQTLAMPKSGSSGDGSRSEEHSNVVPREATRKTRVSPEEVSLDQKQRGTSTVMTASFDELPS